MTKTIDINCDLGEVSADQLHQDKLIMDYITSANIACGFHAGGAATMAATVELAIAKNVKIGAHPGFPDLEGFGRREMKLSPKEIYEIVLYQIGALYGFVKSAGGELHHVKAHGALYNMAAKDSLIANAIAKAVHDFNPKMILYGLSGSEMIKAAATLGLNTAAEVFADRTYQHDGSLTPRSHENALIQTDEEALDQVLMMIKEQKVQTIDDIKIPIIAETICIHGDGEHALDFAKMISANLKSQGITIKALQNEEEV